MAMFPHSAREKNHKTIQELPKTKKRFFVDRFLFSDYNCSVRILVECKCPFYHTKFQIFKAQS